MRLAVLDVGSNTIHLVVVDMLAPAEAATKPACLVHKRDGPSHGSCYSFGIGDSNRADDKITFGSGGNVLSLWGPGA